MGVKIAHTDLVARGERWLKTFGCSVTLRELVAYTPSGEVPDVIGWKGGFSILIECKTSRSDFLADRKKRFRQDPDLGIGASRFYMCPPDVIQPADLPEGWGLLWVRGKKVERKVGPKANSFHMNDGMKTFYKRSIQGEVVLLASALRRLGGKVDLEQIYN